MVLLRTKRIRTIINNKICYDSIIHIVKKLYKQKRQFSCLKIIIFLKKIEYKDFKAICR